jgi:hypothetical protein
LVTQIWPSVEVHAGAVVSSSLELQGLLQEAAWLWADSGSTSHLNFFLATLNRGDWRPRIVAVRVSGRLTGLVYAKERRVAGMNTGLLYADSTLGAMTIAERAEQDAVFQAGIDALVRGPGFRGLRILVPPDGYELPVLRGIQRSCGLDLHQKPVENHSVLPLPGSYEAFLAALGPKSRRNMRYFRQQSLAANQRFVENVPLAEFAAAAAKLARQDVVGANKEGIERGMSIFRAVEKPLLAGLQSEGGEWVSILGGWYDKDRVMVFLQMNSDKLHARQSLSLVMRGYVIEMLIRQGHRDLVWWAGVGPPLAHYVKSIPTCWVYLDSNDRVWSTMRKVISVGHARLPGPLRQISEWVVPAAEACGDKLPL